MFMNASLYVHQHRPQCVSKDLLKSRKVLGSFPETCFLYLRVCAVFSLLEKKEDERERIGRPERKESSAEREEKAEEMEWWA